MRMLFARAFTFKIHTVSSHIHAKHARIHSLGARTHAHTLVVVCVCACSSIRWDSYTQIHSHTCTAEWWSMTMRRRSFCACAFGMVPSANYHNGITSICENNKCEHRSVLHTYMEFHSTWPTEEWGKKSVWIHSLAGIHPFLDSTRDTLVVGGIRPPEWQAVKWRLTADCVPNWFCVSFGRSCSRSLGYQFFLQFRPVFTFRFAHCRLCGT